MCVRICGEGGGGGGGGSGRDSSVLLTATSVKVFCPNVSKI